MNSQYDPSAVFGPGVQSPLVSHNSVTLAMKEAARTGQTGSSRRRKVLDRIASCVCKDRQNSYGDAEDNFANIAAYWNLWLKQRGLLAPGKEVDALDVAQMSSFIKIARKIGSLEYLDNWVDDGGYNVCGAGIVLSREEKA